MGDSEWEDWNKIYQKAQLDLNNREVETAKAAELLERDFTLCGATAIEDKLQVCRALIVTLCLRCGNLKSHGSMLRLECR
jgi:magnesium-transporting ATPase (P-type)